MDRIRCDLNFFEQHLNTGDTHEFKQTNEKQNSQAGNQRIGSQVEVRMAS
jgi:hypothetical protein